MRVPTRKPRRRPRWSSAPTVIRRRIQNRMVLALALAAIAAGLYMFDANQASLPQLAWSGPNLRSLTAAVSPGCNIKGNISATGERIYHMPGQKYYAATRINLVWGERWFCSESEARGAGWRKARL